MIDEVSLGLAPRLVGDMWRARAALRSPDLALLVVDQNIRVMSAHCDRIYLLDDGLARETAADRGLNEEARSLFF